MKNKIDIYLKNDFLSKALKTNYKNHKNSDLKIIKIFILNNVCFYKYWILEN